LIVITTRRKRKRSEEEGIESDDEDFQRLLQVDGVEEGEEEAKEVS